MTMLSTITETDIAAWSALALAAIAAIGVVGTAFLGMAAKLVGQANSLRLTAQHERLESQQTQLSTVQMAMPTTPVPAATPATVTPSKVSVDHVALASLLKPIVDAAIEKATTSAAKQPLWPAPSDTIPPKGQQ